jgi:putative sigma-54 modulation protein
MQLSVTFRKIETTEPIKAYVKDKIKKIKKFFPEPINAHVVLTLERYQHRADVNITLHNGLVLKSQEKTGDMYSAIDLAMDKIERQIRKYKDKIRRHKPQNGPQFAIRHDILGPAVDEEEEADELDADEAPLPRVIRTSEFMAKPMTVEEAIMQMDLRNSTFLVFTNADSKAINVVYKRDDGNFGLIETSSQAI